MAAPIVLRHACKPYYQWSPDPRVRAADPQWVMAFPKLLGIQVAIWDSGRWEIRCGLSIKQGQAKSAELAGVDVSSYLGEIGRVIAGLAAPQVASPEQPKKGYRR